jgi:predicted metalloprotease with PDZ domain
LLTAGSLWLAAPPDARAESRMFTVQETKRGAAPLGREPRLDRGDWSKPRPKSQETTRTFVIQETRKVAPPPVASQGSGIVGLDMLIQHNRYPVVQYVFRHTPAEKAGMRPGDTIVAVDGRQTLGKTRAQVDWMISDAPGDVVAFTVVRGGEMRQFEVTVMALSEVPPMIKPSFSALYPE